MGIVPTDSSLLLYQTEDGQTRIEVHLQDETVWLNQAQLCELFDKDKRTISEHIQNIFREGELSEESVVRNFRTTASDGKKPRKPDVEIAKNYLNEKELKVVNLIVSLYLDFAELQALSRNPMYMKEMLLLW